METHMQASTDKGLNGFIDALKDPEFFNRVGPGLAMLVPGNWDGVVEMAKSHGYEFTLDALHEFCASNPHIFAGIPSHSKMTDWNMTTLVMAKSQPRG
jgi:hypothetical protein